MAGGELGAMCYWMGLAVLPSCIRSELESYFCPLSGTLQDRYWSTLVGHKCNDCASKRSIISTQINSSKKCPTFFRWPATSWQTHHFRHPVHTVFCHVIVAPLQSKCSSYHSSVFPVIPLYKHVDIQQAGPSTPVGPVYQRLGSQTEEKTWKGGNLG